MLGHAPPSLYSPSLEFDGLGPDVALVLLVLIGLVLIGLAVSAPGFVGALDLLELFNYMFQLFFLTPDSKRQLSKSKTLEAWLRRARGN